MFRFRQKTASNIFLLICFLLNFIKLFKFYDKQLDFIFGRTQININLDTVEFGLNNLEEKSALESRRVNITTWKKELCVWFNFTQSSTIPVYSNNPTLCLHGTINYSLLIFEHLQRWPSFISFALFIDEDLHLDALKLYKSMINCYPRSRSFVSTHLVFKSANCKRNNVIKMLQNIQKNINCSSSLLSRFKNNLYKFNRYSYTEYPINSMRNVARFGAKTEYLVNSDIENIFSSNAHLILTKILKNINQSEKETTAVVIRRFEVLSGEDIPENVEKLVKALEDRRVFNFHHQFYGNNHAIPNLNKWIDKSLYSNQSFVQEIKYQFSWEPLTVNHQSSPTYYEGLLYRYRNQMAYVYELCRAKFKFIVASHIFTVHKGIKKKLSRNEKFYLQENWQKALESWNAFEKTISMKYFGNDKICDKI